METKHTRGNWTCSDIRNPSNTLTFYIRTKDKDVAQLRGCKTGEEIEAEANAKLIAAAPELLIACKKAYERLRYDDGRTISQQEMDSEALHLLSKAIKKAT